MAQLNQIYAFGLNQTPKEFKMDSNDPTVIAENCDKALKKSKLEPLKAIFDATYIDLTIPVEIIYLIITYRDGTIIYQYSKQFKLHLENTTYLSPISLGYIETILFLAIIIETCLDLSLLIKTVLFVLYGTVLFIHGLCAYISYYKCLNYQIFIRKLKQILHSNEKYFNWNQQQFENMDNDETINTPNSIKIDIIDHHLFNPTNNTFAFIAYQKWINIKRLQLENDKMFKSSSAFYLCLSKFFLSSLFIFYGAIIINSNDCNDCIFIHFLIISNSFAILSYCYYRIAEKYDINSQITLIVLLIIIFVILLIDIICLLIFVILKEQFLEININRTRKSSSSLLNILTPFLYFCIASIWFLYFCGILFYIFKYNYGYKWILNNYICFNSQRLWLSLFVSSIFFGFCFISGIMARVKQIGIICFAISVLCYYFMLQQLISRIMSGMNTKNYCQEYIWNDPKQWLFSELTSLFKSK